MLTGWNKIFCYYSENGFLWFRIFGRGLKIKDTTKHQLYFTERHGKQKRLKIGNWLISSLRKI
mgnify:CR=1 FL=1